MRMLNVRVRCWMGEKYALACSFLAQFSTCKLFFFRIYKFLPAHAFFPLT